jgi:hypothetical protein
LIPRAEPDAISEIPWLRSNFVNAGGELLALVQSFVVEHRGKLIVVDYALRTAAGRNDIPFRHPAAHDLPIRTSTPSLTGSR